MSNYKYNDLILDFDEYEIYIGVSLFEEFVDMFILII